MYWPIGAPKTYAASKHVTRSTNLPTPDHDDADKLAVTPLSPDAGQLTPLVLEHDQTPFEPLVAASPAVDDASSAEEQDIVDIKTSRAGNIFTTITASSLSVWQTKPTALLATVARSDHSLETYGPNTSLLLRPDALIVIVQTQKGFLITYSLAIDPAARVYQTSIITSSGSHVRRSSNEAYTKRPNLTPDVGPAEGEGIKEVSIRFRMVIRIDAGISRALVLDDELVVTTVKPAAIQCIRWTPDSSGSSHNTELLKRMSWLVGRPSVTDMSYDRPMNLHTWVTDDGRAYAVQRLSGSSADPVNAKSLFRGFCFHSPEPKGRFATKSAINARFSLIAIGCSNGTIQVYSAKDYVGNIPPSHELKLPVSEASSGNLTFLSWSPDGYCLFAGYDQGWAMWSVYGKLGANTFGADRSVAESNAEEWLCGVRAGFWVGGGAEILLLGPARRELHVVEMMRSSVTGCFGMPNISRSLLQGSTSLMLYKGFETSDHTTISGDISLWQTVQVPQAYLAYQWPIRLSVVSADARYLAVAGRRGLAHYSVGSGRWKSFEDPIAENSFTVRGGMCWWQHILVAAVESGSSYEVRLYSREKTLTNSQVLHTEVLAYPVVCMATSGEDSLLVYTYENILLHYIFVSSAKTVKLAQVGQIAFHGIIRAPPRVRAISWILPEDQRDNGDPSHDVATASVLFLVDAKLVLLQPSANEHGELKYDMRVIAHNVEFYTLSREQPPSTSSPSLLESGSDNSYIPVDVLGHSLRDSLWYFDGTSMHAWSDVLDVLSSALTEHGRDVAPTVAIETDFYPLSAIVEKGLLTGLESDLVQRRDINFAFYRLNQRTHLSIPSLLRHHLAQYDSPAALHLSHSYQKLPYFNHALEVLLHDVLDDEVDTPPESLEAALLPSVLSFLSSFPTYLDIVAGCTRKTELRSWETLFRYLPPVVELFEESLQKDMLKTAGSYLLILHAFDEGSFSARQISTLLKRAREEGDWDLCKELARFLVGIDETGNLLKTVLVRAGLKTAEPDTTTYSSSDGGDENVMTFDDNGDSDGAAVQTSDRSDGHSGGSIIVNASRNPDSCAQDYFADTARYS
ncbi:hypothetical protein AUEXF2481DRAFT_66408 [Aureobasidium subglaciale EXF-2481]|uniref:RIC1 C-terminal alpha solenoid region domain-containing protein n=1 Tax=Aureobasidium subglaciale (strain EXF-2481) TaxID=1043005 RepID=A0A074Y9E8_AURSE|nr:uncharacterized protein AUEXF2481DRAFT_66408 [Aureobasidium subglaciale EXF-2481]KAI5209726.1 hypothetical protein E4T38_02279 [Aureobasidium subglaciale]KAI5228617.1 hypothetical protein E4T40_02058 [Aureobasidium subglaciale]KAI5231952.1 hypothetical protein E4T41_02278 [Aureobasidium subglaciale]KAI5265866.1 hypothetical protein E4T46_02056 [Aureobasidium subglaciale]KEQ94390.1 hypothetical protein AUEXF2481DRAFT_66408 [Aureobasidium subglaciale EXF-2481]